MIRDSQCLVVKITRWACLLLLCVCVGQSAATAQTEDSFGDDPIKLFERAQTAHGRGEFEQALELYDEAIKLRPEFAEAEFQRANVLVSLKRLPEAETGFRRAIQLRKNWSLPYVALGSLLVRLNRDQDAETMLRQALQIEANNSIALQTLAEVRLRAGDAKQAVTLAQKATATTNAPASTWFVLALAQRAAGENAGAVVSLDHVVEADPANLVALLERAELNLMLGTKEKAIADLLTAEPFVKDNKGLASRLMGLFERAGRVEDAQRIAKTIGITIAAAPSNDSRGVVGTPEEIEAANSPDPEVARKALELLLQKNPKNASLLSRLGDAYRKIDPARSLGFYRRAMEIDPRNVDYATGFGSALVQSRRFAEAASVLQQVVTAAPDNYAAHANFATALYSLKRYPEALTEYQWLLRAKPDLAITRYFIATAHDLLGEYVEALAAYEAFIAHANPATNQLEIEKVKLRLPRLRRQIQLGQGVKQKADKKKP